MKVLPRALSPWAEPLSTLPEHVASAISGWLGPIDSALGVPDRGRHDADGDPDGYDGVCRRGPYHRLLASEWLLASEVPDEFLRRAVMAEQPFLQLARRSTQARERCAVVLESGPRQLGAPRLAQLAVLVVLARRAAQAGAELVWIAVPAGSDAVPCTDLAPSAIKTFLNARSARNPSTAEVKTTIAALKVQPNDEVWVIGSDALREPLARQVTLTLGPGAGGNPLQLSVRDQHTHTTSRVTLPLPAADVAVRALRDPTAQARVVPLSAPLTTDSGSIALTHGRLTVRLRDGSVRLYPVPNSPNAAPGRFRRLVPGPGERVLAATRIHSRLNALVLREQELMAIGLGSEALGNSHVGSKCYLQSAALERIRGRTSDSFGVMRKAPDGLVYIDPSGVCLVLTHRNNELRATWGFDTLDVMVHDGGVQFIRQSKADHSLYWVSRTGNAVKVQYDPQVMPCVYTGFGTSPEPTRAARVGRGTFAMIRPNTPGVLLNTPPAEETVGACREGLLTLGLDRRRLSIQTLERSEEIATLDAPITAVAVDDRNPFIACQMATGRLQVFRYGIDRPVLDIRDEAGA